MHRVLLADDSKPIRRVVELTLDRDEIALEMVADGAEALKILDDGFIPDIALVDVHMPHLGGVELCRRMKERAPAVQVLLLVGTFEPFDADEGVAAGAVGHLLKPFAADELSQWVDNMLGLGGEAAPPPASDDGPGEESAAVAAGAGEAPVQQADTPAVDERETAQASSGRSPESPPAPSMLTGSPGDGAADSTVAGEGSEVAEASDAAPAGPGPVHLSADDLDSLARKIAAYLAENLFAGDTEELIARVAGEEVRRRIDQLERELADEDADD